MQRLCRVSRDGCSCADCSEDHRGTTGFQDWALPGGGKHGRDETDSHLEAQNSAIGATRSQFWIHTITFVKIKAHHYKNYLQQPEQGQNPLSSACHDPRHQLHTSGLLPRVRHKGPGAPTRWALAARSCTVLPTHT